MLLWRRRQSTSLVEPLILVIAAVVRLGLLITSTTKYRPRRGNCHRTSIGPSTTLSTPLPPGTPTSPPTARYDRWGEEAKRRAAQSSKLACSCLKYADSMPDTSDWCKLHQRMELKRSRRRKKSTSTLDYWTANGFSAAYDGSPTATSTPPPS